MQFYIKFKKYIQVLAAIVLFIIGCLCSAPVSASIPTSYGRTEPVVKWGTDLELAIGRSQASLKPILIFFTGPDCLACAQAKGFVLKNERLQSVLGRFECVEVDLSRNQELITLAEIKTIPSFMVLESYGKIKGQFQGMSVTELRKTLTLILESDTVVRDIDLLIIKLKTGKANIDDWRKGLLAMQDNDQRRQIQMIGWELSPGDRRILVTCLKDRLLAVRLGALEILEEHAETISGLDPWADYQSDSQKAALKYWQDLNKSDKPLVIRQGIITREKFEAFIQDLISEKIGNDAEIQSRYALISLAGGGDIVREWIVDYLQVNPDINENGRRRIKEVQYALVIPDKTGVDSITIAHKLIWGNQDIQVQTIRQLVDSGRAASPVLIDLFKHPEQIIREAAIETLFAASSLYAVEPVKKHLTTETDQDIIFTILRFMGDVETLESQRVLESFFSHENEDLVIVAIEGAVKSSISPLAGKLLPLLQDPRWRVRVAALQALEKKGGGKADFIDTIRGKKKSVSSKVSGEIARCLDDPDAFVRHTAAITIGKLKLTEAEDALKTAYQKFPDMHGVIISILFELGYSIPGSYIDDLFGPDPDDLLFVLDYFKKVDGNSRSLVHRAANSKNLDIACTALRILAGIKKRKGIDNGFLVNGLQSGLTEKQLTIINEFKLDSDFKKSLTTKIKNAGILPEKIESVNKATSEEVLFAVARLMTDENVSRLVQDEAMVMLCDYGHPDAFARVNNIWSNLTPPKRAAVAGSLHNYGAEAIPLFKKALDDDNTKVWQTAISQVKEAKGSGLLDALTEYLLSPDSRLKPAMFWPVGFDSLCSEKPQSLIHFAGKVLETFESHPPDLVVLALTVYTYAGIPESTKIREEIFGLTKHENPFIRRAAWVALTKHGGDQMLANLAAINGDISRYVREVIPVLFYNASYQKKVDLYFSEDESFSGYNGLRLPTKDSFYYRDKLRKTDDNVVSALEDMIENERNPVVRYRCMLTLLSHYTPYDLDKVVATAMEAASPHKIAAITAELFEDKYSNFGKNFALLLPLLETQDGKDYADYEVKKFRKRWGLITPYKSNLKKTNQPEMAVFVDPYSNDLNNNSYPGVVELTLFTTSSCRHCASVERRINDLRNYYSGLKITRYDIRTRKGMEANEFFSAEFDLEDDEMTMVPAVFAANGYLIDKEITTNNLKQLAQRSISDEGGYNLPTLNKENMAAASSAVIKRGSSYAWYTFVSSGIKDGTGIGVLITLLFILSYLLYTRQKGWQLVRHGATYLGLLSGTLLLLWFGFSSIIANLGRFNYVSTTLIWVMVAAMFITSGRFFFLAFYQLIINKNNDSKLPAYNYKRVVVITVSWSLIVAIFNLASIQNSQVLTTIYMIKTETIVVSSVIMLAVYCISLQVPSAIIFLLCGIVTTNKLCQSFSARHYILLKFALSAFWFVVFVRFTIYSIFFNF